MMNKIITILILTFNFSFSQKILIPMDQTQIDHLKAYGIAYWTLKQGENIDWLLNFRGGSFMVNQNIIIEREKAIWLQPFFQIFYWLGYKWYTYTISNIVDNN